MLRRAILVGLGAFVLLPGPGYSASKVFVCSGIDTTFKENRKIDQLSMRVTVYIDLATRSIYGGIGPYEIKKISESHIRLTGGERDSEYYHEGIMNRYTGYVAVLRYENGQHIGGYTMTCKSAPKLF